MRQRSIPSVPTRLVRLFALALLVGLVVLSPSPPAIAAPRALWVWPVANPQVEREFVAPAHAYAPGHRGLDMCRADSELVLAPDDGTVAFVGQVAGRGIVTIDHGDGLVSTLEPVQSDAIVGSAVSQGDVIAEIAAGGHSQAGCLHLGARLNGNYVNPRLFLGGITKPVLLPCC